MRIQGDGEANEGRKSGKNSSAETSELPKASISVDPPNPNSNRFFQLNPEGETKIRSAIEPEENVRRREIANEVIYWTNVAMEIGCVATTTTTTTTTVSTCNVLQWGSRRQISQLLVASRGLYGRLLELSYRFTPCRL